MLFIYINSTKGEIHFNVLLEDNEITVYDYVGTDSEFMTFDEPFTDVFEDLHNPTDDELTLLELETGVDVPKEILYTFKRFEEHKNSKELTNDQ